MTKGKTKFWMTLAATLALATAHGGPFTEAAVAQPAPQTLTATSGGICICHAPLYVGIEKGFFRQRGLDIQFRQISSGFTAMGALQTGDAQVADAVVAVAAQAAAQGIESKAVLVANGDPTGSVDTSKYFAIVSRPGTQVQEGKIETLKGKTIGVAVGTVAHQYLYYTLQKAGIDPEKGVKLQNVSPPDLVSALSSKSVDAIVSWEPIPLLAKEKIGDSFLVVRGGGAIQYLFFRWMSPKFLQSNPEQARAFVEGYLQSMQFARQNPDETAKIVAGHMKGVETQVISEALRYLNFDPRVSKQTLQSAQQGLDFTKSIGKLEGEYVFQERWDRSLTASAISAHPEYVSDLPPISDTEALR
jgi:sulfonate transport system substrate-binding protein